MSEELTEAEKKRRAASGGRILMDYLKRSGDKGLSREEVLTDVLSNLMHLWARSAGRGESTFTRIYERAVDHTQIELGFEQEFDSFPESAEDYDPTPYCSLCNSMTKAKCKCPPRAENE